MKGYIAFLNKEFLEMFRSYKILILVCVFFLLGVMNPLTAKYTPELLKNMTQEGVTITMTDPTVMDSWVQFFKNANLMGIIVIVIVFSNILSNDINKGTVINMVTKGIKRRTIIFSKLSAVLIMWTLCFSFCFIVSYGYTKFLFDGDVPNLLFSVFMVWYFGIIVISALFFGSLLSKSNFSSILFVALFIVLLYIIGIIPKTSSYNPISLVTSNMELLKEVKVPKDFIWSICIGTGMIGVYIISAVKMFNKKML